MVRFYPPPLLTPLNSSQLNTSGQMFHIDFGFIFGQDPKPMPPPFRFTRSMADAMGGEDSEHYGRFKTFCCQVIMRSVRVHI
jgi:phosphatidylinositol 3-kinase